MRHLTTLFLEAGHLLLTAQFAKYAFQFSAQRDCEETELELQWKKYLGGGVVKEIFDSCTLQSTSLVTTPRCVRELLLIVSRCGG
jgi:hypothetical protein